MHIYIYMYIFIHRLGIEIFSGRLFSIREVSHVGSHSSEGEVCQVKSFRLPGVGLVRLLLWCFVSVGDVATTSHAG